MNNNNTANVAVPMPAAMAGLIGDFTSTREVLSELGRHMTAGGAFSDTTVQCYGAVKIHPSGG